MPRSGGCLRHYCHYYHYEYDCGYDEYYESMCVSLSHTHERVRRTCARVHTHTYILSLFSLNPLPFRAWELKGTTAALSLYAGGLLGAPDGTASPDAIRAMTPSPESVMGRA